MMMMMITHTFRCPIMNLWMRKISLSSDKLSKLVLHFKLDTILFLIDNHFCGCFFSNLICTKRVNKKGSFFFVGLD